MRVLLVSIPISLDSVYTIAVSAFELWVMVLNVFSTTGKMVSFQTCDGQVDQMKRWVGGRKQLPSFVPIFKATATRIDRTHISSIRMRRANDICGEGFFTEGETAFSSMATIWREVDSVNNVVDEKGICACCWRYFRLFFYVFVTGRWCIVGFNSESARLHFLFCRREVVKQVEL